MYTIQINTLSTYIDLPKCNRYYATRTFCPFAGRVQVVTEDVPDRHKRIVFRSIEIMEERFREELTIEELARTVGYGRAYFAAIFKKVTGKAPLEYLTKIRLKEVERLLRETSLSVEAICYQVGYQTVGPLHVHFRRLYGCTPREFRKRLQQK